MEIFIKGNAPSSKNGRVWTGRYFIESKRVIKYRRETKEEFLKNKEIFLEMVKDKPKPYLIGFHFVRSNKHKFDFINMLQVIQDQMVELGYIDDDNCDEILPFPYMKEGVYYSVDKINTGTFIKVL